jgi:hypothetical protein
MGPYNCQEATCPLDTIGNQRNDGAISTEYAHFTPIKVGVWKHYSLIKIITKKYLFYFDRCGFKLIENKLLLEGIVWFQLHQ